MLVESTNFLFADHGRRVGHLRAEKRIRMFAGLDDSAIEMVKLPKGQGPF
jgi:hypothetical protein